MGKTENIDHWGKKIHFTNAFLTKFKMYKLLNHNYGAAMLCYEFLYYSCNQDALSLMIPAVINGKSKQYSNITDKERTKEVMYLSKRRQNAWIRAIKRV